MRRKRALLAALQSYWLLSDSLSRIQADCRRTQSCMEIPRFADASPNEDGAPSGAGVAARWGADGVRRSVPGYAQALFLRNVSVHYGNP
jgi:hypothetical protein